MNKMKLFLAVLGVGLVVSAGAMAATLPATLHVTANVQAGCKEVSTTPVNFGNYTGSDIFADGTIHVNCNEGAVFGIKLDGGQLFNPFTQQRTMTGPPGGNLSFPLGFFIGYQLYKDAAHTDTWGDCVFSAICFSPRGLEGVGTGSDQPFTVFGKVFGGPVPDPGAYSDNVGVLLEFH